MKIERRSIVAVLCVVALLLAGLTVANGVYHTRNTARTQLMEQLSELSDYSSHCVRMYFENLLSLSEEAALLIARNEDVLGEDALKALGEAGARLGAQEIVITRADGQYASTLGRQGIASAPDLSVRRSSISLTEEWDGVRVTTPILSGDESIGQLEWRYDIGTVSQKLSESRVSRTGTFHVFVPECGCLLNPTLQGNMSAAEDMFSGAQFLDGSNYEALMADVKAGRSNTVDYINRSGEHMLGFYTLLGINDWYIISVMPESELGWLSAQHISVLLLMGLELLLLGGALVAAILGIAQRIRREMGARLSHMERRVRKQDVALAALGMPPFEFDMHALAAHPIDGDDHAHAWLLERILTPEHAGEVVDPRDEAAYLKLCDAILGARGVLSGDFRLRTQPDAPTRMYRLVLSAPGQSGDAAGTIVTLIDMDDVSQRMDALRQRAARDAITGLDTLSEFRLKAGALLQKRVHRSGALCVVRADNSDAVCDGAGMTQLELIERGGALMRDALGECEVLARGTGSEYLAFSSAQTGADIVQRGVNAVLDSAIGAPGLHLTFSCGIARAEPGEGIDELMRRANAAAQSAHVDGGNRVQHG